MKYPACFSVITLTLMVNFSGATIAAPVGDSTIAYTCEATTPRGLRTYVRNAPCASPETIFAPSLGPQEALFSMNGKIMNSDAVIDRVSVSTEGGQVDDAETVSKYVIHFKSTFQRNDVPICFIRRWSSTAGKGQAERVYSSPNNGNTSNDVEAMISLRSSLWSGPDELRDQILFSVSCVP